jgi:hypothetical protein
MLSVVILASVVSVLFSVVMLSVVLLSVTAPKRATYI